LNVLVVGAVMTESGRQFQVLTILNANEFFLISVRALGGRRVPLVEQELLTLPEHLSSSPVFSGVRVTRSLVLCVFFADCCLSLRQFQVLTILNANEFFLISVRALGGNIFTLLPRTPLLDVMSFNHENWYPTNKSDCIVSEKVNKANSMFALLRPTFQL
jgi:hypothetical protein